jgi:hypothetical protein
MKELYERSLAIFIRMEGLDGLNISSANNIIGRYHFQLGRIYCKENKESGLAQVSDVSPKVRVFSEGTKSNAQLASTYLEEAVRIKKRVYSPNHPKFDRAHNESVAANALHLCAKFSVAYDC